MTSKATPVDRHDDLDNYDLGDLSDNPFASPSPPSKKRKEPDESGLGLDQEVSVQKRARVPRVKLDEDKLLGPAGIPKLRARARNLKIKGKGHEFSDASRLLSFYQLWLDDLFPKAKFLDALAMVEKAGHKKKLLTQRGEWINEGKPKSTNDPAEDVDDIEGHELPGPTAPSTDVALTVPLERPTTPEPGNRDIPDDDDLYDATPRTTNRTVPIRRSDQEPDPDDLEALMAEAETQDASKASLPKRASLPTVLNHDGDDQDALMAETGGPAKGTQQSPSASARLTSVPETDDFADDEAALQEMGGW